MWPTERDQVLAKDNPLGYALHFVQLALGSRATELPAQLGQASTPTRLYSRYGLRQAATTRNMPTTSCSSMPRQLPPGENEQQRCELRRWAENPTSDQPNAPSQDRVTGVFFGPLIGPMN